MTLRSGEATVVVLDLDDTLYSEIDYQTSGYLEVCRWIEEIVGVSFVREIETLRVNNELDVLGALCELAGLPLSTKESLLWIYRLHRPAIRLSPAVSQFMQILRRKHKVAILTDGRAVTQRQKLKALGLTDIPVYISEEYSSVKPSPYRFELITKEMPAARYVYIGDNPKKDFIAPNALGWMTIGLRDRGTNIHRQHIGELDKSQLPAFWVHSLDETLQIIC